MEWCILADGPNHSCRNRHAWRWCSSTGTDWKPFQGQPTWQSKIWKNKNDVLYLQLYLKRVISKMRLDNSRESKRLFCQVQDRPPLGLRSSAKEEIWQNKAYKLKTPKLITRYLKITSCSHQPPHSYAAELHFVLACGVKSNKALRQIFNVRFSLLEMVVELLCNKLSLSTIYDGN